ncbi:MAG: uroporphyrinogen-III C-methyltransferase [Gammaproteobacteria bacterium]|nr:uroporphyrinogen-III C-methyltransferase [Gammaproteobacteria bacterium]
MTKDNIPAEAALPAPPKPSAPRLSLAIAISIAILALLLSLGGILVNNRLEKQQENKLQTLQNKVTILTQTNQKAEHKIAANAYQIQTALQKNPEQSTDWNLQKACYYLDLAQINAAWTHDLSKTLTLLKHADAIFATLHDPQLQPVRQAISQDILSIQQVPNVDTVGLLTTLKTLQNQIDTLNTKPMSKPSVMPSTAPPAVTWQDHVHANLKELQNMVVIHHHDEATTTQLGPQYLTFLREMMHLNLQQAEIGLISQQQTLYTLALGSAINILGQNFNPEDAKTKAIVDTLKNLQDKNIVQAQPALNNYLQILNQALTTSISTEAES